MLATDNLLYHPKALMLLALPQLDPNIVGSWLVWQSSEPSLSASIGIDLIDGCPPYLLAFWLHLQRFRTDHPSLLENRRVLEAKEGWPHKSTRWRALIDGGLKQPWWIHVSEPYKRQRCSNVDDTKLVRHPSSDLPVLHCLEGYSSCLLLNTMLNRTKHTLALVQLNSYLCHQARRLQS